MGKTFSGHEISKVNYSTTWLTPPPILDRFPMADLDPCASPKPQPWATAHTMWTEVDDGLNKEWFGRVWLNPPYGNEIGKWMQKMAEHCNGLAITYARTDTRWFHDWVAPFASSIYLFKGRLRFHRQNGERGNASTAPHMLIAYGAVNAEMLSQFDLPGILCVPMNGQMGGGQ